MTSPDGSGTSTRPRLTSAGRLLAAVEKDGRIDLKILAHHLGVPRRTLFQCRDGAAQLDPATQMKLAALVLTLVPDQERGARRLFAQAQTALRMEAGSVEGHVSYPKEPFR